MLGNLFEVSRRVREASPLVVNITNYVVMNNSANALLAVGASPVMCHAHSEIESMVGICGALVVNIGTLDEYWVETMLRAAREADRLGKPWVLDPVGAGATPYRDEALKQLVALRPTVIRGNASEVMAVARAMGGENCATAAEGGAAPTTKGVDSTAASGEALAAARWLSDRFGSVVCVSGESDIVVSDGRVVRVNNGSTMMTRVTGLGCSCSAVMGAFVAVVEDRSEAVTAAAAMFALCGQIAAAEAPGPGTLQVRLLDKLYNITREEFDSLVDVEGL